MSQPEGKEEELDDTLLIWSFAKRSVMHSFLLRSLLCKLCIINENKCSLIYHIIAIILFIAIPTSPTVCSLNMLQQNVGGFVVDFNKDQISAALWRTNGVYLDTTKSFLHWHQAKTLAKRLSVQRIQLNNSTQKYNAMISFYIWNIKVPLFIRCIVESPHLNKSVYREVSAEIQTSITVQFFHIFELYNLTICLSYASIKSIVSKTCWILWKNICMDTL